MKRTLLAAGVLLAVQLSFGEDAAMKNVLIVYGSWAGSTAEVAERMKTALGLVKCAVTTMPAEGGEVNLAGYDLVVIGSAIHGARPHEKVRKFVDANRAELSRKRVAVFATCITITSTMAAKRKSAQTYPGLVAHGLIPVSSAVFAGKAPPSGWFGNLMGRLILGITPGDYRNWAQIDAWAVSLLGLMK